MTKIGNGNGLICRLHSKPHTVRAQNTLRSQWHFTYSFPKTDTNDKNREWEWPYMWFTFKTSYCSSPKHIEMIVAFCDNLHYQLKAEFFFPILFYCYFKISFHQRTLYDTFSCLIPKHFLPLHKKYNIIHYLI